MERVIDGAPRAIGVLVGLTGALLGVAASWELAFGPSENLVAGLALLVVGTPLLALLAAAVNFWFVSLLLTPVRSVFRRHTMTP